MKAKPIASTPDYSLTPISMRKLEYREGKKTLHLSFEQASEVMGPPAIYVSAAKEWNEPVGFKISDADRDRISSRVLAAFAAQGTSVVIA